jgi:hypothetical protein
MYIIVNVDVNVEKRGKVHSGKEGRMFVFFCLPACLPACLPESDCLGVLFVVCYCRCVFLLIACLPGVACLVGWLDWAGGLRLADYLPPTRPHSHSPNLPTSSHPRGGIPFARLAHRFSLACCFGLVLFVCSLDRVGVWLSGYLSIYLSRLVVFGVCLDHLLTPPPLSFFFLSFSLSCFHSCSACLLPLASSE